MATWTINSHNLGVQNITETSTLQSTASALGHTVEANHATRGAGVFIYLKGVASTAVGSWVSYSADDYTTTLLTTGGLGPVAVSLSANLVNQFGWYMIKGKASALAASGFADNGLVYATAVAGTVDDAVVEGDEVLFALGASAVSGGLADFEIDTPRMSLRTDQFVNETGDTMSGDLIFSAASVRFDDNEGLHDAGGDEVLLVAGDATPVNQFKMTNADTTVNPILEVTGGDTNIGVDINTKGTGEVVVTRLAAAQTIVTVPDATNTLALTQALHANRLVYVLDATLAITLPEATGTGDTYTITQGIAATASTIVTADTTNAEMRGMLNAFDTDDESTLASWPAVAGDDTITLNGVATGGKIYDRFVFTDILTDVWLVSGQISQSGGAEATPFSSAA